MNHTLNIYCDQKSARLSYVLDFVFIDVLKTPYCLVDIPANDIHISYSKLLLNGIQIIPHTLLFEESITEQDIHRKGWNNLPTFFSTSGHIPFDIFSAIFYLISRYEEYLPHTKDSFQRYSHQSSLAFKEQFLHQPLVDQWIEALRQKLNAAFPINIPKPVFRYTPTYDIDMAYSYLGKGFSRNAFSAFRDLFNGKFTELKNRWNVLENKMKDPYDAYYYLDTLHKTYQLQPIYFFLLSDGGYLNKNLPPDNVHQRNLILSVQQQYETGIHPSYNSQLDSGKLKKEILRLGHTENSRQHYIQFTLPETFRLLRSHGIKHEYSMGYGSINGFRASTSHSFFWFDLMENTKTDLTIHPFCYMECNARFEQDQSAEQSLKELIAYKELIQQSGGNMITIFHNFSLGTDPDWKGWREMYEEFLGSH